MSRVPSPLELCTDDGVGRCRLVWPNAASPLKQHFSVSMQRFHSAELNLQTTQWVLLLCSDLSHSAELTDFNFRPDAAPAERQRALTELLSLARAACRQAQPAEQGTALLTVSLAGVRDTQGHSPFWQGLGQHFIPGDVDELQSRHTNLWLARLAAVLPRQAIYMSTLDRRAQQCLGQPREDQAWLADALQEAGWMPHRHVRLDDGGPVFAMPA